MSGLPPIADIEQTCWQVRLAARPSDLV